MADAYNSPIKLGSLSRDDHLGYNLLTSASNGNKKKIKRALEKGIHVDYPNSSGQSALFCACHENQEGAVEVLLSYGANPNERSNTGVTPVHVAAFNGNIKVITELLSEGGDLRLHDSQGRTAKDWALMQPDPKKRLKMIEFLEKTRLFALTQSGQDLRLKEGTSHQDRRAIGTTRNNSIIHLIREKLKGESTINLDHLKSSHSMGYGKVYLDHESVGGIVSAIPLVSENLLHHDKTRITYENGAFTVMQSMTWRKTKITVKRLHRETDPGGEVDLLIKEADYLGRVRHPYILQLMGICQTDNLDGLVLIFENINMGSLFHHLHVMLERMPSTQIQEVSKQIADAILFLHEQNLLHCYLTSHAVSIISPHLVKLGNFEYVLEREKAEFGKTSSVHRNIYPCAAYNWMSPEVMNNCPPSHASDMYSFSAVLWEILHFKIPWCELNTEEIQERLVVNREPLQLDTKRIPEMFLPILEYGLQIDPLHRSLTFEHVIDILSMQPEDVHSYVKKVLKPQRPKASTLPHRQQNQKSQKGNKNKKHIEFEEADDRRLNKSPIKDKHVRREDKENVPSEDNSELREQRICDSLLHCKMKFRSFLSTSTSSSDYNHNGGMNHRKVPSDYKKQMRFVDQMHFTHKNLDWDLQEEQQGDEYYYSVGVKPTRKENKAEYQSLIQHGKIKDQHDGIDKQSDTETCTSSQDQLSQDSQLIDHKCERPLGGTRFSYLQVQQMSSPPGACTIKPASHCTAPYLEKPQDQQLSTAGSIYALYNMHPHDDQFTPNRPSITLKALSSTLPRKRKRNEATPEIRPRIHTLKGDKNWFGGKGSVRDLVQLYQNQVQEHMHKQDVLEGKTNQTDQQACHARKIDFNQPQPHHTEVPQLYPDLEHEGEVTFASSLTTVSADGSAAVSNSSSVESALLEKWVSSEVQKVQNTLSEEVFGALKSRTAKDYPGSPLLFEEDEDFCKGDTSKKSPNTKDTKTTGKGDKHHKRKPKKKSEVEEFYFDDDLQSRKIEEESHMKLLGIAERFKKDNSLKSSFMDLPSSVAKTVNGDKEVQRNSERESQQRHGPQLIPAEGLLHYDKMMIKASRLGAYQSTVTVRSSYDDPSKHVVTHTLTDMVDGTSSTLYGKTVKADKVSSGLFTC